MKIELKLNSILEICSLIRRKGGDVISRVSLISLTSLAMINRQSRAVIHTGISTY